jgi:hypothetical protein
VKFHKTVPWAGIQRLRIGQPYRLCLYWLLWTCSTADVNYCNNFKAFILEYLTLLYEVVVIIIITIHLTSMLMGKSFTL